MRSLRQFIITLLAIRADRWIEDEARIRRHRRELAAQGRAAFWVMTETTKRAHERGEL